MVRDGGRGKGIGHVINFHFVHVVPVVAEVGRDVVVDGHAEAGECLLDRYLRCLFWLSMRTYN